MGVPSVAYVRELYGGYAASDYPAPPCQASELAEGSAEMPNEIDFDVFPVFDCPGHKQRAHHRFADALIAEARPGRERSLTDRTPFSVAAFFDCPNSAAASACKGLLLPAFFESQYQFVGVFVAESFKDCLAGCDRCQILGRGVLTYSIRLM
jgi:hypothetical protein